MPCRTTPARSLQTPLQQLPLPEKPYRLGLAIAGVFALYIAHDALQERAFRTPGYAFGWFMTLVEIVVVSACAFAFEWGAAPSDTEYSTQVG